MQSQAQKCKNDKYTLFLHRNTLNIKLSNFGIILVEDFYGHISLDMNLKTKNSKTENKTKCAP